LRFFFAICDKLNAESQIRHCVAGPELFHPILLMRKLETTVTSVLSLNKVSTWSFYLTDPDIILVTHFHSGKLAESGVEPFENDRTL